MKFCTHVPGKEPITLTQLEIAVLWTYLQSYVILCSHMGKYDK